jgi:transposase
LSRAGGSPSTASGRRRPGAVPRRAEGCSALHAVTDVNCVLVGASIDPPSYDAGKKIKGKKRHILVDTQGLLIHAIVHAADIQDRDGGAFVMATMFGLYPFLIKLYADGGYQGPLFRRAAAQLMARVNVEIVKRSDHAKGFVVLPKRWVVERTFAWLGRCRRLAKDWENLNRKALAFLRLASIRLMLRKLCNPA